MNKTELGMQLPSSVLKVALAFTLVLALTSVAFAGSHFFKTIKGTVKDVKGNPIADASVLVKGSSRGTRGSDVAKANEINPINALQGKVADVQIDQGAGGLFGNSKIVIRGNSTLGTHLFARIHTFLNS